MNIENKFSSVTLKMKSSKIRELMKYASMPGVVSLAGGLPDPANFPFDEVKSIINKWDDKKVVHAMQYGSTQGYPPLIDILTKRMLDKKNINMGGQSLIITTGGQQSIFLLSRIFVDPDDVIIVEEPSFIGAMAAFLSNSANLAGVPLEDDGVNIDALEKKLKELKDNGKKVKFFYTIPNFQNPAGVTMSQKKRKALYDLAIKYELVIVEDDPYGDLYFTENEDNYKPIKSLGNDAEIIYISSFSKILCPGFRLGWMVADDIIIDKVGLAKQSADACSSSFGQVIAYDYLESNLIDNYLTKMRKVYREKKEFMLKNIVENIPKEVTSTNPEGGFFLYLNLPEGLSADAVFKKSFEEKVAFVTGEPFHVDSKEGDRHIRLSYSNPTNEEMSTGIRVIGKSIKNLLNDL